MKKFFYLALALCMGFAMTSCDDDENTVVVDFEGDEWVALIDNPQYNGPLLYGEGKDSYDWTDTKSGLSGGLTRAWGGDYGFSEGGTAISNYIDADIENHANYQNQLAVPMSNGSKNFAVVYCDATIKFADGAKHQINSIDIAPTTYLLGCEVYGDGYAVSLAEEGNMTLTITADNGMTLDVDMAKDGNILKTWKRVSLKQMGAVNSLSFTMDGSDKSTWGVKHPKYFAFDNVVVNMD